MPSARDSATVADWLNISHELRTPANAILGHLDLLLSGSLGPLSSEARASLGDIQKASIHLLGQTQRVIEIGQRLPFPTSCEDNEIGKLASSLHRALTQQAASPYLTDGPPSVEDDSSEPSCQPAKWLRVVATLLHEVGATLSGPDQHHDPMDSDPPDSLGRDNQWELRFQYQDCRHADSTVYLSMIEAALSTTGGALRYQPGQLILFWPAHHHLQPQQVTA